jgi:hypothetical protein
MKTSTLCALFFIFMMTTANAQWCGYGLQVDSYTPINIQTTAQVISKTITLTRDNNSNTPNCQNYRVYIAKGYANSYQRLASGGSGTIPYNFYSSVNLASIIKDYPDGGPGEFLVGYAPSKNVPYVSTWYISAPSIYSNFTTARAGTYTDSLPVNIYQVKNNGDIEYQTAAWIGISIVVPRYVEMSIVGENQPHDAASTVYIMNFGTMTTNQELRADLRIVGNVGYDFSISSQNGGKLKRSNGGTEIPYTISIANQAFTSLSNANSPYYILGTNDPTDLSGQRYPIAVRLGTVPPNPNDGTYSETITITINAH